MKIYRKPIDRIAKEIIARLVADGDLAVERELIPEAEADLAAILRSYVDTDEKITEEAKATLERRGMAMNQLARAKEALAQQRGHIVGDEGIDFVINQMLEFLLISQNVEEVFGEDPAMRRKIYQIMKRALDVDADVDTEARGRLKHLQEGTAAWDIEYGKEVEKIKRLRGLT